ncbi:chromosome segregation ATPase [Winogradskyella pacifica]|uniref:Chromosome segregation ATPase n=1 Tax=Winogradskyella pacifica TaxID=664642 RepID=A0A3D9LJU9_9FLAO|nr:ATP-binding protein [Winogradskyella pacifica]REE07648.1 chromosome segregation ATPase [Winogradskyella pacifica]
MRYLNKIVFINSASVKYAEIELDGNVHLIGTQGVGKSTLLRAILFFYNANKTKLGIPREKKGFDDYYFEYQNSYIIYEIIKDNIPFCVLAYKVNGKVAFRFFNSEYKRALFIDNDNRAFENWDKIRNAFGKEIYYTHLIKSYEDFRRIIYGDNAGLKPELKKYALIESRQYQNIPRTIQNVLLNTNLEAKFIKDTIINSLNEEEFVIDIENYAKNHLRDFESQINDIKIWFKENRKGQIVVRKQADKIIDRYRFFNFLKREKKELTYELASRFNYIENEKSILHSNFSKENNELTEILKKRENLAKTHRRREQDIVSDIKLITTDLAKAKQKKEEYDIQNINQIISKVSKKDSFITEQKTLEEEKNLLTSKFAEISQRFQALITQIQNRHQEFANGKNAEINKIQSAFADNKTGVFDAYQKLINQIKEENKDEVNKGHNKLETIRENENSLKRSKSELKHKTFFLSELKKCEDDKKAIDSKISSSKIIIQNATNQTVIIRKEWELEAKEVERIHNASVQKEKEKIEKLVSKIETIENKIQQSKSSLYGWLNENIDDWQNNIGKVIDEDNVLFNTELNPKLINSNSTTLFGIELNLNTLKNSIKTVKEYNQEIEEFKVKIIEIQSTIKQLNVNKEDSLQKLKTKFRKQLNSFKEVISENDYIISQNQEKLKKNKIDLDEWVSKAKLEKETILQKLESDLDEIASKKLKAQEDLEVLKNGIKRKISLKENERNTEIESLEDIKNKSISEINISISSGKDESDKRIQQLKKEQTSELGNKGADTKRLNIIDNRLQEIEKDLDYIKGNETIVIEYNKDKRELFDKVPQLKVDKTSLEKKQTSIISEHKIELNKINTKYSKQEDFVKSIQSKIDEFETDEKKFIEFKEKSETYKSVHIYFSEPIREIVETKTAISIITEINDKHYKGIETFKELQQSTNAFIGNFGEQNIFSFKVKLNDDKEYLDFASDLKEFIEADKINEYEKRVNDRFAHIIHLIGRETTELNSKKGEIEKIIKKINDDFIGKNFVQAIKGMEMKTLESSNPIVKLLIQIKEFNDENSITLGETNLFTSSESNSKNQKAVELLKQLVRELMKSKSTTLTLSESFDLQFRIIENDNDSGWVEKLSNVGSEGTDVLVKAMINILLLNVFKDSASKKFKDFKLHCMMDEIGRLHPNNVKGILRFANERNILLINGSPTSQNATDYKYTYKLAKEQSKSNTKKYITKINRLVKVNTKVLN